MPDSPNKLSQFWQELIRRKVVRVITVYAAAAFVILELVDIITEPFGLPDWTLKLVVVLLSVGLIVSIILSWIYDIKPEGGLEKTPPTHALKEDDKPVSSNSWKIASYISFVVIVGLIVLNIIPRANRSHEASNLDKSIAVLPFRNDSPDEGKMYFINGTMEAILDNLCKIEDLRVPGRTSVEQYRDNPKPIPTVAEELNVSYILEGSGHRDGSNVRLIVQLLDGRKDQHIWSKTYDADIEEIFSMQSEIAQLVAREIEAIITPEEKQLIEKVYTANLTAHDFYLRGREEYYQYLSDQENREALGRAEERYNEALEYDSAFALAYTGLAQVYWSKQFSQTYFSEEFLDSVLILADIALTYDNQLSEAYTIKGQYYNQIGQRKRAIGEFDKAIKLNPNDWMAYWQKAIFYTNDDFIKAIDNALKAASLNRGPRLPEILDRLGYAYHMAGFFEKSIHYAQEVLNLNNDSVKYYLALSLVEAHTANRKKALEYVVKAYNVDSTDTKAIFRVAETYAGRDQFEESLRYFNKWTDRLEALGNLDLNNLHRIGYLYFNTGNQEMADYYFDKQVEYCVGAIELDRPYARRFYAYYDLAAVYAFRGETEKAFENLWIFNKKERMPFWAVDNIKESDPLFDKIRDEPEFQQIVRDVEAKYQAEHERVKKWLEENDML